MIIKRFSSGTIPIEEMETFYRLPKDRLPQDRPYVWYMFVHSADGRGSFRERGYKGYGNDITLSGPGIALAHLRGKTNAARGSEADYRLLQYLWATADAIVGGSGIIKAEPELIWRPTQDDLVDYRKNVLHKGRSPVQVVLTGRGLSKETLSLPIFNADGLTTIIATSEKGHDAMRPYVDGISAQVEVLGQERVDIPTLLSRLKSTYHVDTLDLQGGPRVATQFLRQKLIDEHRFTRAPVTIGSQNSAGETRPGPYEGPGLMPDVPVVQTLEGVRMFGEHVFFRERLSYELFRE